MELIIYFIVGLCLSYYWWNKTYDKDYTEAKESGEGVEEGMAVNHLLMMMVFWPLILTLNLINNHRI